MIVTGSGTARSWTSSKGSPRRSGATQALHDLARARLPGRDAARREAAVHDRPQLRVAVAVLGDQVARGGELEGVHARAPDHLREEAEHVATTSGGRFSSPPAISIVNMARDE